MIRPVAIAALALGLAATPAFAGPPASTPSPSPTPGGLPIKGVTVEVQPVELAPGLPPGAPAGSHVERPPGQGFTSPKRPRPSATPSRKP